MLFSIVPNIFPNKEGPVIVCEILTVAHTGNPLPLIINPPTPLIINTPQIWYTIIYWEYLLLGGWGGLLLGGGDYLGSLVVDSPWDISAKMLGPLVAGGV